jgi:surface antigen
VRLGRAAVLVALPALMAVGVVQGERRGSVIPTEAAQGVGTVVVRVSTDGHPQLVRLVTRAREVRRAAVPVVAAPRAEVRTSRPQRVVTAPPPVRRVATVAVADTYPWAGDTSGGMDPWGFTKRQCVSYVAYRLAEAGAPLDNGRDHWGSALDWDDTAQRLGFPVRTEPSVGAVAQWDAGEAGDYWAPGSTRAAGTFRAGPYGHVAWVTQVFGDGSVQVAQYNGTGDRDFSTMRVRAPRYLLLG